MSMLLKRLVLLTLTLATGLLLVALPVHSYAQGAQSAVCEGIGATAGTSGCTSPTGTPDVNQTIAVVVNILSAIVGIVAVIMIIVAGLKFITSSGDANNISSARNTILYAIVGLVVAAMAQLIVHFVLNRVSGTPQCNVGQTSTAASPCR